MSLLSEMKTYGLADCEFNRGLFANQKYQAYQYWAAKQGIKTLSFNAWLSTNKPGRLD